MADVLGRPLVVANAGVDLFADELERQGVRVDRVEWRPPEPGTEEALARLALDAAEIARANDEAVERIESTGVWIGILDEIGGLLEDGTFELEPGDTVLLYSDGLTEAVMDGKMLGVDGLEALFVTRMQENVTCEELVASVIAKLDGGPIADDVTILALRRSPPEGPG